MAEDLLRLDYGDPEIAALLDKLYKTHRLKGLAYRELFCSKLLGTIRYLLLVETNGTLSITNLDTGEQAYKLDEP